jgi:hypothetical protein
MPDDCAYPRPEYPRPQRQRGTLEGYDWLNLNGPWQFRFDPDRRGHEEKWFEPDDNEWREQIIVPFCWESLSAWGEGDAAGNDNYYSTRVFRNPLEVTRENHRFAPRHEVGWYRRIVSVPANQAWEGKRVILTIGAADFFSEAWCNGHFVGRHEGGYTPFEFDITDALSEPDQSGTRRATLVLRVEDPMDNSEQPVGKQWRWYTSTSGIWQTVFLEPRHTSHIEKFRIHTDIDSKTARFLIHCIDADYGEVAAQITPPEGTPFEVRFRVKGSHAEGDVRLDSVYLWNPNEPHLYKVVLRLLREGAELDLIRTYFGMRKIDAVPSPDPKAPGILRLNGVARYLRGALYQSYFPEGVYTAADVSTIKDDIAWAKKFGFNFLRVHIKVDDPVLLHLADQMGMMLMCDFPNFGEGGDTEKGRRRFEQMMRETVDRDFNHPSIFAWCIFNETWGFGGQLELLKALSPATRTQKADAKETQEAKKKLANSSSHAWVRQMWELAKTLDPTRLVEDMSVVHWEHLDYFAHGKTDINSWHFYLNDYSKAREHIEKVVQRTYVGSGYNYVPGFQHAGEPLINSEYGGVSCTDGDRDVSWSFKFLTNELRRHPQISAYIYTELHDVEWEYNGFLNYDRTPKQFGYDPTIINESNVLVIDAPPAVRVRSGEPMRYSVASSHFSSKPEKDVTLEWRIGGIDTRGRFHQNLARGWTRIPFPHRRVSEPQPVEIEAPSFAGLFTVDFSAYNGDGKVVARNFTHIFVMDSYPLQREELPRGLIVRRRPEEWSESQWSLGSASREDQARDDVCFGIGHGFFEWQFPIGRDELAGARRIRVICEAASHRTDHPQTDDGIYPTNLRMLLNDIPVYDSVLRNHPHDARGVLSYLREGYGGYGYLVHAFAEDELLRRIVGQSSDNFVRLRCQIPEDALAHGGLTIYGAENGRYPVCPTLILER